MNKSEVIKRIGKKHWKKFWEFMEGQTVSKYKNGSTNFYEIDVKNFLRKPKDRFSD